MNYENHSTEMLIREITGHMPQHLPRLLEIARHPELLQGICIADEAASRLEAGLELGMRYDAEPGAEKAYLAGPEDVSSLMSPKLRDLHHERFYVLLLDNGDFVIEEVLVTEGTSNASLAHPREVFKEAIRMRASSLILVHNHPSGIRTPSKEHHAITKKLWDAGKLLDIPVRDHVIICESGFVWFAEQGWI